MLEVRIQRTYHRTPFLCFPLSFITMSNRTLCGLLIFLAHAYCSTRAGEYACLLGDPITEGPIDLYHGLSNYDPSWASNLVTLEAILRTGYLFPRGADGHTWEQAVFQFAAERLSKEETILPSGEYMKEHEDRFRRVVGPKKPLEEVDSVMITRPGLLRTGTNFFTTGDEWKSFYTRFITLHFHFDTVDLSNLGRYTAGQYTAFRQGHNVVVIPQAVPIRSFLTSVIINDKEPTFSSEYETRVRDLLIAYRLSRVQVRKMSELDKERASSFAEAAASVRLRALPAKLVHLSTDEVIPMQLKPLPGSISLFHSGEYPGYTFTVRTYFEGGRDYYDVLVAS
jgi:hypothetical protein